MIEECKKLVPERDKPVLFETPMIVKISPHTEVMRAYGVLVTGQGELKVMDIDHQWHIVLPNQLMIQFVVNTLYQLLKLMKHETKV